jgi:L-ascorbate metabolism protein UlaG (beta-lactamase superfamily)
MTMKTEEIVKKIHWLGHDTVWLEGSVKVCIDPFQISTKRPADLILITHEHFDHCSPDDVAKIQHKETIIVTDAVSAKKLRGAVRIVAPGDTLTVKGVDLEVGPAYNTNKDFHPKKAAMLSFVVTLDGVRYYHAGDTDLIPEMKGLQVDVAFLPVSGTYVMTAEEAIQAARVIKPGLAIPMHYGAIVGSEADAVKFEKALLGEVEVTILPKEAL